MEEIELILTQQEQRLQMLEREMAAMQEVQTEIRSMNETLIALATELKHTNEHLARHERKIDGLESAPRLRLQQIATAIIAALAGSLISLLLNAII